MVNFRYIRRNSKYNLEIKLITLLIQPMSLKLEDPVLDAQIISAFLTIETEKSYHYYDRFKPILGPTETYRNYIGVFIGLALYGLGPGRDIQHIVGKLHGHPFEVTYVYCNVARILQVLPKPITQTSAKFWVGKMQLFSEEQQEERREILNSYIPQILVEESLRYAYPYLLENRDVKPAEDFLTMIMPNFPN